MAGGVHVRTLTSADVPWAIALTDTESWGYTAEDFERLRDLESGGLFVAEIDRERVGLTATIVYGKLAYIGAVIVDANWRGRHVGEALMHACLDFLDDRGVESARLNAYLNVIPFYERLGFRQEFENRRFAGRHEGLVSPGVRLAGLRDLAAMGELDESYFGADRTRLLRRLLEEFPRTALLVDDGGDLVAFAFGNPGGGSCEIGPFVCPPDRGVEAGRLLYAMFATADLPCAFSVPSVNAKGVDLARSLGLQETFRTMRMVRGSDAFGGEPRGIFALAGLEKG